MKWQLEIISQYCYLLQFCPSSIWEHFRKEKDFCVIHPGVQNQVGSCRPDSPQGNIIHYVFTVIRLKLCNVLCSINNNTEQGELWNTLCFFKSSNMGKDKQFVLMNASNWYTLL